MTRADWNRMNAALENARDAVHDALTLLRLNAPPDTVDRPTLKDLADKYMHEHSDASYSVPPMDHISEEAKLREDARKALMYAFPNKAEAEQFANRHYAPLQSSAPLADRIATASQVTAEELAALNDTPVDKKPGRFMRLCDWFSKRSVAKELADLDRKISAYEAKTQMLPAPGFRLGEYVSVKGRGRGFIVAIEGEEPENEKTYVIDIYRCDQNSGLYYKTGLRRAKMEDIHRVQRR